MFSIPKIKKAKLQEAWYTLPTFNVAPEKGPFQKDISPPTTIFEGLS